MNSKEEKYIKTSDLKGLIKELEDELEELSLTIEHKTTYRTAEWEELKTATVNRSNTEDLEHGSYELIFARCSNCREISIDVQEVKYGMLMRYCPNCGCKMTGASIKAWREQLGLKIL